MSPISASALERHLNKVPFLALPWKNCKQIHPRNNFTTQLWIEAYSRFLSFQRNPKIFSYWPHLSKIKLGTKIIFVITLEYNKMLFLHTVSWNLLYKWYDHEESTWIQPQVFTCHCVFLVAWKMVYLKPINILQNNIQLPWSLIQLHYTVKESEENDICIPFFWTN